MSSILLTSGSHGDGDSMNIWMPYAPFYFYAQHPCLRGHELLPSPIVYYESVVRTGWNESGVSIID